ncbi:MAG: hypothetical protein ABSG86_14770 [Thermoguttaceae bacterium]|jgi:hypothetical protein
MVRMLLAGCVLAGAIVATGCHMGEHPYDYCGPVWAQGRCVNCNPDYRAGSVLSGSPGAPGAIPAAPERIEPEPIPAAQPTAASAGG